MLPCVVFEDEHLLVVNKPAGVNTHSPGPYAGEGIYDWLRHREPRWENLAIIHRLDKETSGVMVFGKTSQANRSLTEQFTRRVVRKKYLLLTDRAPSRREFVVRSKITRKGDRYGSSGDGELAETRFRRLDAPSGFENAVALEAEPLTGRTHQIRVHAAEQRMPVLGDSLYGGTAWHRVCLHAAELRFRHPLTGQEMTFTAAAAFDRDVRVQLRTAFVDPSETDSYRLVHGSSDRWPGLYVDRFGKFLLAQSEDPLAEAQLRWLQAQAEVSAVYHKTLTRQVRRTPAAEASPVLAWGEQAPERFQITENAVVYEVSFTEGYSAGLFLDQRDNRRRLLNGYIAAGFPTVLKPGSTLLNTFSYTCGFSVCAARAGLQATSLDLSRKYLDWGRRNFELNKIDPAAHDFIYGDVFEWLRRLGKKGRTFDVVLLDPPTFSQSKEYGVFRVEKNYGELVSAALAVLKPEGVLFASTNAAGWRPEKFLGSIAEAVQRARRIVLRQHYVPQPPDFPVSREEAAYLKTAWLQIR